MDKAVQLTPDEYRRVLTFFEKAVAAEPARWSYWCDIGFCRGRLGQWQEAVAAFERVVGIAEVTAPVLSMLGHAYIKLGRYPDAEAILNKAHALAPDNLNILYEMALVRCHRGEIEMALLPLQQIVRHKPRHVKAQFNLGVLYHRLHEQQAAERQIDIVRDLDQKFADRLAKIVLS